MIDRWWFWLFVAFGLTAFLAFGVATWLRTVQLPAARYHETGEAIAPGLRTGAKWAQAARDVPDPAAALARLDEVARATPRTDRLAGSVADGHVSYVTRSRVWGFPDVTNVWIAGGILQIRGQAVFGGSDFGVNRRRVEGWLSEAGL